MEQNNIYGLLVGVGDYREMNITNLPTYQADLSLCADALCMGLKVSKENIRRMAGEEENGYVAVNDLARAIASFKSLLGPNDTFIFYYSGHGMSRHIMLSNGQVELQSVIHIVDTLPAKSKLVILDCCYSGNAQTAGARTMQFEDSMDEFAGHGMAIFASCAANEVARLGQNGRYSMFTGALSTAIVSPKTLSKGRRSLSDIYEETMHLVNAWNRANPNKQQQPIFRSNLGGTMYFQVEKVLPEQTAYTFETEDYKIVTVKSISTKNSKRLCAFVIPKKEASRSELIAMTKRIAETLRYAEIPPNPKRRLFQRKISAKAIWCYFGRDEHDILNHLHYAYTIWAEDQETRKIHFRPAQHAIVEDDIYLFQNPSYDMVRDLQKPKQTREEFVEKTKKLLSVIVTLAEAFAVDLQEVANKTLTVKEFQTRYKHWSIEVKRRFIELSDSEAASDELHDWSEAILDLVGWVGDMAVLVESHEDGDVLSERELWLIRHAVSHYQECMEKIRGIEKFVL